MSFTDSTTVKSHLGITGTNNDTVLATLITQVDSIITARTKVKTGAASGNLDVANEIVDSDGTEKIHTKYHPINSLASIQSRDSNNDWEAYDEEVIGSVEFSDDRIYTKYVVAGSGERQIRISYNAGYLSASIPEDLKLAATLMVAALFNTRKLQGMVRHSIMNTTFEMSSEDFYVVDQTLKRYTPVYVG